jgi:hypothetical protein
MIAIIMASCGGTGGGPSNSGNQFVFTARGRLSLVVQPTDDPRKILITATLLDPQGLPFRNTQVTFTADFPDATFIPGDDNKGSVHTDDNGQATITLIAGLIIGKMRILAEGPAALNIATGVTVTLTAQGFISLGDLGIIPAEVIFINPLIGPNSTDNPMAVFHATGGTPPYRWDNSNKDLGKIEPTGIPGVNETAKYTLLGPIPTNTTEALQDTITLLDAAGNQVTATVTVIFADCKLKTDGAEVTLIGVAGAQFQVDVSDGVGPFTVTETFPGSVIDNIVCDSSGKNCRIVFTLPDPPVAVDPDTILIRDARGCTAQVKLTVQLCGNGVIDAVGEQCDGSDFGDSPLTCADLLGTGATGVILCTDDCKLDDSKCVAPPSS